MNDQEPALSALVVIAAIFGTVAGAILGGLLAGLCGFALLTAALLMTHTSGDQATGVGGLILLPVPFGMVFGAIKSCNIIKKYFDLPNQD